MNLYIYWSTTLWQKAAHISFARNVHGLRYVVGNKPTDIDVVLASMVCIGFGGGVLLSDYMLLKVIVVIILMLILLWFAVCNVDKGVYNFGNR